MEFAQRRYGVIRIFLWSPTSFHGGQSEQEHPLEQCAGREVLLVGNSVQTAPVDKIEV